MSLEDRLLRRFSAEHPAEAARILENVPTPEAAAVLAGIPDRSAVGVLLRMSAPAAVVEASEPESAARLLSLASAEQAAGILRRVRAEVCERLLDEIDGGERMRLLLVFPEGTAGALMDPQVPALTGDLGLVDVRRRLGRLAPHLALELYVVDGEQRLMGFADLREVIDDRRGGALETLSRAIDPLPAFADAKSVEAHPSWGERGTLPVVDERGVYLGAVRAERLRLAVRDADARHAQAGLEALEALGDLYRLSLGGVFTGFVRPQGEVGRD